MIPNYPHLKLVDVRRAKLGEKFLDIDGYMRVQDGGYSSTSPIVAINNAYSVWNLEDLKIPEGYEPDGETLKDAFREPLEDGLYLTSTGQGVDKWFRGAYTGDCRRLCLRKIAPKTKRVLVVEYDNPSDWMAELLTKASNSEFSAQCTDRRTRIEERPA